MNEIYQFRKEDAFKFAEAVHMKAREKSNQLEFVYCPYCHGGDNKDKQTFHISLDTGQFECKRSSCSVKGNMITLAKDFSDRFDLGRDVRVYYNIDGKNNWKRFKDAHRNIESKDPAVEYLASRGISEEICRKYEVTTMNEHDNVLAFPFRDEAGEIVFFKYRKTDFDPAKDKNKEWSASGNCKKVLFGMTQCEDFTKLVITEGQIDSLSCAEAGVKNAVSVPTGKNGFTWKPNVWDWLLRFDEIIVFGDNENGEITLAKEISQFFPKKVSVVKHEDYRGHKDANEILQKCGKEAVLAAVDNAQPVVSFRIRDLSTVESRDFRKIDSYRTSFPTLDAAIGNGIHKGELVILTGKCGEGKSTFASQVIASMLKQGVKVFVYSGELPADMFKEWLDYQVAGTKDIKDAHRNVINDFYRERCYIYDDSSVIDEKSELENVMVQAIRDLKCEFILIDNLMTAMDDDVNIDLYRQQSGFVKKLTKVAKGFNVMIMLVAHPKKGDSVSNDSISGSGDITNRANIVLRFQRDDKNENEHISNLMITKNRTTGKLMQDEKRAIKVVYDPDSMRISELNHVCEDFLCREDAAQLGFESVDDMEDIPF